MSKGSVEKSNLQMLDHAYQAIAFEIFQVEDKGDFISKWNKGWGNVFFPSRIETFTSE